MFISTTFVHVDGLSSSCQNSMPTSFAPQPQPPRSSGQVSSGLVTILYVYSNLGCAHVADSQSSSDMLVLLRVSSDCWKLLFAAWMGSGIRSAYA